MKLLSALALTMGTLCLISPAAKADNDLGDVIRNTLRGEIRDGVVDSVRRNVCRNREEQDRDDDFCDTWQDLDQLGDTLRRTSNGIRAIDAIFD
jgi:hypothetical protein